MSRWGVDSTNYLDLPRDAAVVAGYVDGAYRWPLLAWLSFPTSLKVRIACFASTDDGDFLDVESGCSAPDEAPGWVLRRRTHGAFTGVYMSQSQWGAVRSAFQSRGIFEPVYWVANWDGVAQVPANAVAKQYANASMSGGHYDQSIWIDYVAGLDPAPAPAPAPPPPVSGGITGSIQAWSGLADLFNTQLPARNASLSFQDSMIRSLGL